MVKNDFFEECLDCVLTTHKVHNMLPFQVNISIVSHSTPSQPKNEKNDTIFLNLLLLHTTYVTYRQL